MSFVSFRIRTQTVPRQSHEQKREEGRRRRRKTSRQKTKRQFHCRTSRLKVLQVGECVDLFPHYLKRLKQTIRGIFLLDLFADHLTKKQEKEVSFFHVS